MLTVAGIQMACGANRDENLGRALDFARIAVERGAKIVCFGECFAWPWFPRKAVEASRPAPRNKRVWASVEKHPRRIIREAFEDALRRDPQRRRR